MRPKTTRALSWALLLVAMAVASPARAIIVITDSSNPPAPYTVTQITTTDPAYTTGPYAGSGSQYEGNWQNGAGTTIAPNWFLTSTHLGGTVGTTVFNFQGTAYTTIASVDVGNGMTAWEVSGTFSTYAPIYANSAATNSVAGASTSDFGFGVKADLTSPVTGPDGIQGYLWGGAPSGLTWGAGSVNTYATDTSGLTYIAGGFLPSYGTGHMSYTFATGDSGGGTFVKVNGTWELAGVNFGVDGPYQGSSSTNPSGAFNGALWDQKGFTNPGVPFPNGPQAWYSTNISQSVYSNIITAVPEPASLALLVAGFGLAAAVRPRLRRPRESRSDGPAT
jgi:hypothetical protein